MRERFIINSALWSAYGDALGFISELTDQSGLKRRISASHVEDSVAWRRRIGGRFGVEVTLPPGAYSDDTQLRLATSRSIRGDGLFDVETFAKVELPVWQSYALGAGRASKRAAANLSRGTVNWFSNFFDHKDSRYLDAGGNGAAMRIQPHVWSAGERADESVLLRQVIRNTVTTHGHPRGMLGALFHASTLHLTMKQGRQLDLDALLDVTRRLEKVPELLRDDDEIATLWLPSWETKTAQPFASAWERYTNELRNQIISLTRIQKDADRAYQEAVLLLDAQMPDSRGSATKTALLASYAAFIFTERGVEKALKCIVNHLGTDTDSIATMSGALLGGLDSNPPVGVLQDSDYISTEAKRLARISDGEKATSFRYPDLLSWTPPKNQSDALRLSPAGPEVMGLGRVIQEGEQYVSSKGEVWQNVALDFGQSMLIKREKELQRIVNVKEERPESSPPIQEENREFFAFHDTARNRESIDELTSEAIRSNFSPEVIGRHILRLSESREGIEKVVAYAAIVAKARISRIRKQH